MSSQNGNYHYPKRRIAMLSDTRLPTSAAYPGHGLGKQALTIAEGLAKRGHDVTLWGAPDSVSDAVEVRIWTDERDWPGKVADYDIIIDSTHQHRLQYAQPEMAIINWSQDREALAGRNPVFGTRAHRNWHVGQGGFPGYVIPYAVETVDVPRGDGGYVLFLGHGHRKKAPLTAWQVARLAGEKLVMAGFDGVFCGEKLLGPVSGEAKWRLLANARVVLFFGTHESSGIVALEAQACGAPVLVTAYGGARENIAEGLTGMVGAHVPQLVDALKTMLDPVWQSEERAALCRKHVRDNHNIDRVIASWEFVIEGVIDGAKRDGDAHQLVAVANGRGDG